MRRWSVRFLGQSRKLLSITGQCVGYDVSLEADAINFGTVCLGSSRTKRLQLSNAGEMASRFRWEPKTFGPHIRWGRLFDTACAVLTSTSVWGKHE